VSSEISTWIVLAIIIIFWVLLFSIYEKRKEVASYKQIEINLLPALAVSVTFLMGGLYLGYFYTNEHYQEKELSQTTDDQNNLICQVRIQEGKSGDVKSDYFVFEQSAKEKDCQKFIDYKNLPDDTESFWLGF
jgi:hypothetical protein